LVIAALFVCGHYGIERRRRRLLRQLEQFHQCGARGQAVGRPPSGSIPF
jgi:hypothetical protein